MKTSPCHTIIQFSYIFSSIYIFCWCAIRRHEELANGLLKDFFIFVTFTLILHWFIIFPCRQIVDSGHKDNALSLVMVERTYHFVAESPQDWKWVFHCTTRAYSSSLLRAIIARNHLSLFKIFSNFVHFRKFPNRPFLPFLNIFSPFFWKNRTHALTF